MTFEFILGSAVSELLELVENILTNFKVISLKNPIGQEISCKYFSCLELRTLNIFLKHELYFGINFNEFTRVLSPETILI